MFVEMEHAHPIEISILRFDTSHLLHLWINRFFRLNDQQPYDTPSKFHRHSYNIVETMEGWGEGAGRGGAESPVQKKKVPISLRHVAISTSYDVILPSCLPQRKKLASSGNSPSFIVIAE